MKRITIFGIFFSTFFISLNAMSHRIEGIEEYEPHINWKQEFYKKGFEKFVSAIDVLFDLPIISL